MKKLLTIAIAALGFTLSSVTLADHERSRHGYDRHRNHVGAPRHYRAPHYAKRHWKEHRSHSRHYYRPAPYPHHREVRYYHDDDLYKWMGGMFLLNEVLHHNHH